jgi:hypothetical protein
LPHLLYTAVNRNDKVFEGHNRDYQDLLESHASGAFP